MADQHARQAIGAGDVDLAALHGEQDFGGALVAAHDLELRAGIGVERHGIKHRGRAAARRADRVLLLAHVGERFDPGRRQRHAGIDIGGDAADVMEIRGVHLGRAADRAVERQGLRQAAEHGAVLRRHLRHIFRRDETAGARHVLRQDRRIAGQMARQEFRDQPRIEVVAAARPIADQHADGLAAVEVGDRIGARAVGAPREHGESGNERCDPVHRAPHRSRQRRLAPQRPRPRRGAQHGVVRGERLRPGHEIDRAADGDGGKLLARIDLGVIGAEHGVGQRRADHGIAVAAHQHHRGVLAELFGEVLAEVRRQDHQVGAVADAFADFEQRHAEPKEAGIVQQRPQFCPRHGERHHGRRMAVHHRVDVGPRLVDFAVDEALAVEQLAVVLGIDGLAVEVEDENVGGGHRFRRDRARDQIAVRIARVAHADMAEGIEHVQSRQRAVGGDEIVDEGLVERPFGCAPRCIRFCLHRSIVPPCLERADRNNFIAASEVCHNARPMQHRRTMP